jgi:hypothetical protein
VRDHKIWLDGLADHGEAYVRLAAALSDGG